MRPSGSPGNGRSSASTACIGAKPTGIPIASAHTATKLSPGVRTIVLKPSRMSTNDGRQVDGLRDSVHTLHADARTFLIAAAHFARGEPACHVLVEGVVEVTQNEWRLGAADEQAARMPCDARPAFESTLLLRRVR